MLFLLIVLTALPSTTFAKKEWKDDDFKFSLIKTILIKEPLFEYNQGSAGIDRFARYDQSSVTTIRDEKLKEFSTYDFIYEKPRFRQDLLSTNSITNDTDMILTIKVTDFGKSVNYSSDYYDMENTYNWAPAFDSKGNYIGQTREHTGTRSVYRPAEYKLYDIAEVEILLINTKTGKMVWQYSDRKSRFAGKVQQFNDRYISGNGPEIVLKGIFEEAFKKIPLSKPKKEKTTIKGEKK